MKINFKIPLVISTLLISSLPAIAQTYCIPETGNCESDGIVKVAFAGLEKTSGCGTGYEDYTAELPNATVLTANTYTLSVVTAYTEVTAGVWIDYDHDGVFTASEYNFIGISINEGDILTREIQIPADAQVGITRMRIKSQFFTPVNDEDACLPHAWSLGETEDYSVVISGVMATPERDTNLVTLYPNPAFDKVAISSTDNSVPRYAALYDIQGRKVKEQYWNSDGIFQINLDGVATGIYTVAVLFDDKKMTRKLVVSH